MFDPKTSRGYLNNNPGNIDRGQVPWKGEIRDINLCTNNIQRIELNSGRFCVFTSAEYGIRAMARNLHAYRDRLGCDTIRDYINRWAPPNENNTDAYIADVAAAVKIDSDVEISIDDPKVMSAIIHAIIRVECGGMPYEEADIMSGIALQ